ncbi:hypothetical protein FD755_013337, partial [Muntiacus reevesi]
GNSPFQLISCREISSPSAWPTIHQPFTVSCLTLWSPGYWPQPIQRKEWDSGIFENLRATVLPCPYHKRQNLE